jgi:sensor domain CHASE-containing protein
MKGGNCFMNSNLIKILSIAATVIGMGATLVTDWVNDKKMDEKIEQKVIEALTKIRES